MDRRHRLRAVAAACALLLVLGAGCSSTKSQPVGEIATSSPQMMSDAQMAQLQKALAAGAAKGPLATSTTTTAGATTTTTP